MKIWTDFLKNFQENIPNSVECELKMMHSKSALTRFANSQIHQNVDEESADVYLTVHKDGKTLSRSKNSSTIDKFLANNDDLRHVVRRAFVAEKLPYSEIQDNTIGHSLMPIDMLRLKLSFFGVLKFDPRSDKWLRINMFQGAPLPDELKNHKDQWIYNSLN